ncbi:fimbria/pilus outer membrane usher protein [Aeromonas rivuli]|uniref:fimbria/pilus outer membrane usher protein n=1 Tax=Aeromonas rivuli TaxID=648794 RepID=UPI001CCDA300|nr:fimbria/pilus outer membrane usher protein [Aeromonas rivuli]UBO72389.1 fimbrial biogenesis outer membrane usher protein [Aeromonas rivuli]
MTSYKARISKLSMVLFYAYSSMALAGQDDTERDYNTDSEEVEFDPSFLHVIGGKSIDLHQFGKGAMALPGHYTADLYINDVVSMRKEIEVIRGDNGESFPCVDLTIIKNINFDYQSLPKEFLDELDGRSTCINIANFIPASAVNFDSNEQRLDISIPQRYLLKVARGAVNENLWENGIPALLLGYGINGYSSASHGVRNNSIYAGIDAGLNIGSWYFRHKGSYNWADYGLSDYSMISNYVRHDSADIGGTITIGQSNTTGQIFDSLPYRGISVASNDSMLPSSLRGYAPEVRGVARTNARVIIRQNNQTIYDTTVSPGEFVIDDLYPTGYGGDLDVSVNEADGSEHHFKVPYNAVSELLRPGTAKYSFTAGKYYSTSLISSPSLLEMTYQFGLTNYLSLYSGGQASDHYYTGLLGSAMGTPVGAFSFDISYARTELGEEGGVMGNELSGQSYRVSYSKDFQATGSNLAIAANRFSSDGFMDFQTAMQTRDVIDRGGKSDQVFRAKNRFTVSASQSLPVGWGHVYVSSSVQNYWNRSETDKQYQAGYSNQYRTLSYGLSLNRSYNQNNDAEDTVLLNFSMPLGVGANTPQLRLDLSRDSSGHLAQQATLSGSAGEDNQMSYGLSMLHDYRGRNSVTTYGQYRTPVTNLSGSINSGYYYNSETIGLTGTLVAHEGGITATPYNANTFALVEAKGAEGASVSSYPGVRVDGNGYALVPNLTAYQINNIELDPNGIAANVGLENTLLKVVPRAGAVVKAQYQTRQGTPLLINARYQGKPVPFGAKVRDETGDYVGAVGQGGQLYARVAQSAGSLVLSWGEGKNKECRLEYALTPSLTGDQPFAIVRLEAECLPL